MLVRLKGKEEMKDLRVEEDLVEEDAIAEASVRLAIMGWHSYVAPAIRLPSGLPSGGAAVLVNRSLGSKPCARLGDCGASIPQEFRHRGAAASVYFGECEVDVYSLYLLDGVGLSPSNIELLTSVVAVLHDRQSILAGDFQNRPAVLEQSDLLGHAGLEVLAPPASHPSIRSNLGNYSVIDFFLATSAVAALVDTVQAKLEADFRPHRPVGLHLPRSLADSWVRTWKLPPALPREAVVGPQP